MTLLDWLLVIVWFGVTLSGFWKGAARLVFGVGGLVAGVWLAVVAGGEVAAALGPVAGEGWLAAVLGRTLVFAVAAGLCLAAGWGLERTLRALCLGWLNRLLGAALAAAAGGLILAVLVITAARLSPPFREVCARSKVPPRLIGVMEVLLPPEKVGEPSGPVEPSEE